MALMIIGIVTCFNFIIIIMKYRKERYADGTLDLGLMAIICWLFSGTFSALTVGMVASMGCSIYLWFYPFYLFKGDEDDDEYEDI